MPKFKPERQALKAILCVGILLLFFAFPSASVYSQSYSFRHFEVEDGLADNTVFSSFQDKKGFLWFGTKAGLNRFDGHQFKLFKLTKKNGSPYEVQYIFSIISDHHGTMWVGSSSGLFYFNEQEQQLVNVMDTISTVHHVFADQSNNLWVLAYNGFYRYHLQSHQLTYYNKEKYFNAYCVCQTDDGTLWFGTNSRFLKKYDARNDTFSSCDVFSHSPGTDMQIIEVRPWGSRLLIGTSAQGLKVLDVNSMKYQDILSNNANDKTSIYVRDILQYDANECWLATESGIYIVWLDKSGSVNLRANLSDPYSLSDNAVYTLTRDKDGGIWAGTWFGGVNYYSPRYSSFNKFLPGNSSASISGRAVREMTEDPYGNLWIGTEDAGLCKYNRSTGVFDHFKPTGSPSDLSYYNIHGLICLENNLWIGTYYHGIDVMDVRTGKVWKHYEPNKNDHGLQSNFPVCFFKTRKGQLMVGTNRGLFFYQSRTDQFIPFPAIPSNLLVRHITEATDGTIWVATGGGLYHLDLEQNKQDCYTEIITAKDTTPISIVNDVMEDSRRNLWFTSDNGGVFRLRPDHKTFDHYSIATGLPSNFTFRTIEDNDGNIWLTTANGLVSFAKGDLPITIYTTEDGLLNNQFNYASGFKDHSGTLYFGSTRGMITFNPEKIRSVEKAPPLYFTTFITQNGEQSIDSPAHYVLPYNQSSVSIGFAALSYNNAKSIHYSYKMEGSSDSWHVLETNQQVTFTSLPPGNYTFKVKAFLPGRWVTKEIQLSVKVNPPFWASVWAYICYAMLLLLLIYAVIRYNRNQAKLKYEIKRVEQLEEFTHEMSLKNTELQHAYQSLERVHLENTRMIKVIAHDLRNPVGAIVSLTQYMKEFGQEESAEILPVIHQAASNAMGLMEDLLKFSFAPSDIHKKTISLNTLIQQSINIAQPAATHKKQTIFFDGMEATVNADQEKLWRVFSNLLNNAIKFSPPAKTIIVSMQIKEAEVITAIRDEGIGIPPSLKDKIFDGDLDIKRSGTEGETSFGFGLRIAYQIVQLHSGRIWVESEEGKGTTFYVSLTLDGAN